MNPNDVLLNQFKTVCMGLHDSKLTTRKEAVETLSNLLLSNNFIDILNQTPGQWTEAFTSVKTLLYKELTKCEAFVSKGKPGRFELLTGCRDLLHSIVENANAKRGIISFNDFYRYVRDCYAKPLFQKHCLDSCLIAFKEHFMQKDSYWGEIDLETILGLKDIFKSIHLQNISRKALGCYNVLLKKGCDHKLPVAAIKQETDFINSIVLDIQGNENRWMLETAAELLLIFCQCCIGSYKQLCITEGEKALLHLQFFYVDRANHIFKTVLMEIMILQLECHIGRDCSPCWRQVIVGIAKFIKTCIETNGDFIIRSEGDNVIIDKRFIKIVLGCYKHAYDLKMLEESTLNYDEVVEESSAKRARKNANFLEVCNNFDKHIEPLWILLFSKILEKYPETISESYFERLLTTFSNYVKDCASFSMRGYVFKALSGLISVEQHLFHMNKNYAPKLIEWLLVYDSAIRTTGLNQSADESHLLLQQLLIRKHDILSMEHASKLWNLYISRSIQLNVISLQTFHTFGSYRGLRDNTSRIKNMLIDFIMQSTGLVDQRTCAYVNLRITAEILTNLSFKHYTNVTAAQSVQPVAIVVNPESYNHLLSGLRALVSSLDQRTYTNHDELKMRMQCTHLVVCLMYYYRQHDTSFQGIKEIAMPLIHTTWVKMISWFSVIGHVDLVTATSILNALHDIIAMDESIDIVKPTIGMDLIEAMVEAQYDFDAEPNKIDLKFVMIKIFTTYALKADSEVQQNVQLMLYEFEDFDPFSDIDYKQAMIILGGLANENCKLSVESVRATLTLLQRICQRRIDEYNVCVDVLCALKNILWHLIRLNDLTGDIKDSYLGIFKTLHQLRRNYGYKVELALVNCLDCLLQANRSLTWAKLNDEYLVMFLPYYLVSDYLEVQQQAIKTTALVFTYPSNNSQIDRLKSEVLDRILVKLDAKILSETNDFGEDQQSIILHMFFNMIISSKGTKFTKLALCELFVRGRKYAIPKEKIHEEIKNLVAKQVDINTHLHLILKYWCRQYSIVDFPHFLFNYDSKKSFYLANLSTVALTVLKNSDDETFETICNEIGKTVPEVLEKCYSKFIAINLIEQVVEDKGELLIKSVNESFAGTTAHAKLNELYCTGKGKQLMRNNIDDILIETVRYVHDPVHFEQFFNHNICISEPDGISITHQLYFGEIMRLLSEELGCSVVKHLTDKSPAKMHQLLSKLQYNIWEKTNVDDKIIEFYYYSIIVQYILEQPIPERIIPFILRYVIYMNINLIKHEVLAVQTVALKFMSKFIEFIIPKFTKNFAAFITITSSAVVPHAILGNPYAVNVLRAIMFSDHDCINANLEYLDPLPENNPHLTELRQRHMKFRTKDNTLENEINLFLVGKQFKDSRTEGLKYLRGKLKQDGSGLKRIYLNLLKMRGILSKESVIHSLITTLVELVRSKDEEESMEAVKCLGILGASDLTTMVLKSEEVVKTKGCSSYSFTAKIIDLLTDYLVDRKADIARHASKAMFAVLCTEEGRNILKNEASFSVLRDYLWPFVSKNLGNDPSMLTVTEVLCNETLCNEELWCPTSGTHEEWIITLVVKLLEGFPNQIMKSLLPIVQKKASFAEECFPYLINLLMDTSASVKSLVGRCVKSFFQKHWTSQQSNSTDTQSVAMNMTSIRCVLNAIHFLRQQRLCNKRGQHQELDMDLDYLHLAKAAVYCSAHFSALLYSEKWYHASFSNGDFKEAFHSLTPLSILGEISEDTKQLQLILMQAFKGIGDKYALFGGHLEDSLNPNSLCINDRRSPDFQLLHRDIELNASASSCALMTKTLRDQACYNLAVSTAKQHIQYGDTYYECMWRLSQWDLPNDVPSSNSFEFNMYNSLNAFNDNDKTVFDMWVAKSRLKVAQSLKTTSLESCKTLYGSLSNLERLQELEDIFYASKVNGDLKLLVNDFKIRDEIHSDYQYWEPRIAQRVEAINILRKRKYQEAESTYVEMSLNFADASREYGNLQVSKRILNSFANLDDPETKAKVALLDARIYWKLGHSSSISKLKTLLCTYNSNTRLRATILKLCGEWMVKNQSEFPKKIFSDYFHPCLNIISELDGTDRDDYEMIHDSYKTVAKFADEEYQHINKSLKSPEFEAKVAYMNKMKENAQKLNVLQVQSRDIQRARLTYERMIKIDEIDIKHKQYERENFLKVAIRYYLFHMRMSSQVEKAIFRIFSLWLENKDDDSVTSEIEKGFLELESYKILTMLPQLVPHISVEQDKFSNGVNQIVEKCAREHPHHSIPFILSVANTNQDDKYTKDNAKTASNEFRIRGAQLLIGKLRKVKHLREIVEQNEKLASAYIELAYYKCQKASTIKIPRSLHIYNIRDLTQALLPTYTLPFRTNLNYNNIIGVHKFKPDFTMVGGINAPKRLECIGTDGVTRYQLVKGTDDLRQDAVMQQVFVIMNELLRANKETLNFKIRTYKVVPLSKRSGVLEWVENTTPLGTFLAEAHKHYYPRDKKLDVAKAEVKAACSESDAQRLQTYLNVCEKVHPVFHKFFEANFLEPTVWYEKRRAYTQSVATSSMCGYVLGIGDRHVANILVDKATAEVVHIDFGIAFEGGRILPTPETVPFRLTRDIVDGMGVCGVEGTFRRTCEKTMEVLRKNVITIQTIVEVLLYDPLYDWSITPTQAYSKQMDEDSTEDQFFSAEDASVTNANAERTLSRLKHKLLGIESGNNTNVDVQVDRLIRQARAPSNLSKLFYGWQAYL